MNRFTISTPWESPTSDTLHQTLDAVKSGQRIARAFPIRRSTYVLRCSEEVSPRIRFIQAYGNWNIGLEW